MPHIHFFFKNAALQEKSSGERSDAGSQAAESDYDVDEEYDNDYADNYFDNGEGDDVDDLGGRSRYVYLNHADNNLFIDHIILLTTVGGDYD